MSDTRSAAGQTDGDVGFAGEETSSTQTPNLDGLSQEKLQAYAEAAIDRLESDRLSDLIGHIQDRQRSRQEDEKNRLLEKFREEAARLGMQVRLEPIGATSGRRSRGGPGRTIAPKYRGPNGETWSGRGIPPKWLTALEATGRRREEFLIAQEYEV